MRKRCDLCGAEEPSFLAKAAGAGIALKVKECKKCGLVFCSQCGVFPNAAAALIRGPFMASGVVCPHCNPRGWRGDR